MQQIQQNGTSITNAKTQKGVMTVQKMKIVVKMAVKQQEMLLKNEPIQVTITKFQTLSKVFAQRCHYSGRWQEFRYEQTNFN